MTQPMEIDLETPEVDAAEQAMIAVPSLQDDDSDDELPHTDDVSEWDAQEQGRVVEFDDDYR
ncbi:hypothetical protein GCM10010112_56680 [Actinoplanes lobatus]|uniref:Uncharacterized protein n=1 Tax=Actinoplanes lobatus TaxID=113568 RepID=A0A7W7HCJ9_9ACTN|nr:hypothetical protein [Actinoplanes lobatus]MBB4748013.1 hypothetical protein [Actinoplanes lobatus]GGN80798.1 hypothetical protein GCM10010112_56680 [Actinoplanes lobatus]GIE41520.1 hypothetical protein Alo02nite_44180 [Actinoplanes lobatus]